MNKYMEGVRNFVVGSMLAVGGLAYLNSTHPKLFPTIGKHIKEVRNHFHNGFDMKSVVPYEKTTPKKD